jgi:hypothetical protein
MRDIEDIYQNTVDEIKKSGWQIIYVFDQRPFAYTIGLTKNFGHPEVIISGLPSDFSASILNTIASKIKNEGFVWNTSIPYPFLFARFPAVFRSVDSLHIPEYFRWACRFYGSEPFQALQCLWPDTNGKFPGEPGYAHYAQTVLYSIDQIID